MTCTDLQSKFWYPAKLNQNDDNYWSISFPDLSGRILHTSEEKEDCLAVAANVLSCELRSYLEEKKFLPDPKWYDRFDHEVMGNWVMIRPSSCQGQEFYM